MTGFVFASIEEAKPFLKVYERGRFEGLAENESAHDDNLLVSIVGIGKIKATLRTERLLREHRLTRIVHGGMAQSLVDELRTGTLVSVGQVFEGDRVELSTPTYPRMPLDNLFKSLVERRLVTQDHVVAEGKDLTYWQRIADITDSTGYPVAYVAATHGVPCSIVKVVTGASRDVPQKATDLTALYEKMGAFMATAASTLAAEL
jgi:nucleoside phosphorylase